MKRQYFEPAQFLAACGAAPFTQGRAFLGGLLGELPVAGRSAGLSQQPAAAAILAARQQRSNSSWVNTPGAVRAR
ncbi:hypothetical protein [Streptomyces roseifaciens]|uniref:hypothetical protein n=1 Tax=Streptomyces roseifaciens TaxID=1488406 RepID=UPI00071829FB